MSKKRKPHRRKPESRQPAMLKMAGKAFEKIALRESITVEMVRKHIQVAMISGMMNADPQAQHAWARIPHAGETPTPEEVVCCLAEKGLERRKR